MDLTHRFTVPTSVEETWAHFNDIAGVAECFPGAVVTDATDVAFAGSVKVKLGPIALLYNGSGTFVEKDEEAHRFVVEAKGKDKRGNGTAGANVAVTMTAADGAAGQATEVEVLTDLAITGKPAQFGRGVMQDVSDKLLGRFVQCLEQRLTSPPEDAGDTSMLSGGEAARSVSSESTPSGDAASEPPAGDSAAGPSPAPDATPPPAGAGGNTSRAVGGGAAGRAAPGDDALDLGSAVLPVLVRSYGPQLLGAGALIALLVLLVRRRLRRRCCDD